MNDNNFLTIEMLLGMDCFKKSKVVCGMKGTQRIVKWAHVLEVNQVEALINGGELILTTGIGWAEKPHLGAKLLDELIENQASGLCVELNTYVEKIPEEMVEIAEENNFPIIVFENQVRFIDITKKIYDQLYFPDENLTSQQRLIQWWNNPSTAVMSDISTNPMYPGVASLYLIHPDETVPNFCILGKELGLDITFTNLASKTTGVFLIVSDLNDEIHTLRKRLDKLFISLPSLVLIGQKMHSMNEAAHSINTLKETNKIYHSLIRKRTLHYDELFIEKLVVPLIRENKLSTLIDDHLFPLIKYDQENDSNLLITLDTYLSHQCNKQETANALFIVRQTLYHRLDKIKKLLKTDFTSSYDRLSLEIALWSFRNIIDKRNNK
ncbi:PucR family transcriptional regulator [Halobacillus shinanisalinarum]|uniref:PucR family transcriptional regulator n=1 Tax=Halobacillus shinanisalinarum TaxID=2932258 RepID=A0ABY4GVT7_9BACI|nr:PucR family transcriptional regulator [Halobacillus shinanisalinarum]UOQ92277.1 PucR family transcriptional regulator [Halobacillus shinanisalinarum]